MSIWVSSANIPLDFLLRLVVSALANCDIMDRYSDRACTGVEAHFSVVCA